MFNRIKSDKRGFTLVELVATVAILAVLVTIAIVGVLANSVKLKEKEYDQNAEAIAVAAQSRLTALKNAGDTDKLAALGVQVDEPDQRFVSTDKTEDMDYILPPFSIDGSLREKDFVIGFSSTTAKVSEVFFFANGLPTDLSTEIENLRDNKKSDVGYYKAAEEEVVNVQPAGAQLPTPQLSINNFENLQLDIYLPYVRQLPDIKLGFKVMLVGKDELPKEEDEAAKTIYETPTSVQLETGNTYSLILDTPKECLDGNDGNGNPTILNYNTDWSKSDNIAIPKGRFSTWARLTSSYIGDSDLIDPLILNQAKDFKYDITGGFKLGEDVKAIVKVYAMKTTSTDGIYEQDKMYVTRTASVVFNGWFQSLTERPIKWNDKYQPTETGLLADISCGRHLQNLSRLTEMRKNLLYLLPTSEWDSENESYKNYTWGAGNAFSYIQSSEAKYAKYVVRHNTNDKIIGAYQLMPIDFDNKEWYSDSEKTKHINFEPIGTVKGFYYFGNYYPIRNLHVHTDLYAGLFSYTYQNKIYDVRLVNPSVRSDMPMDVSVNYEMGVGGLIGTDRNSNEIYNCQVYLEKINISKDVKNPNYVYAKERRIEGNGYVGGLIGFAEDESIRQCSASCFVGSTESHGYVGGLIGAVAGDSSIKRCYGACILRGEYVGGLLGAFIPDTDYSGDDLKIESCYTAGNIEAAVTSAGGLIGYTYKEQRGYEKSAVRAHKNYCVVIYGEEVTNGETSVSGYIWRNNAKIYGTFDGDYLVWNYCDDEITVKDEKVTQDFRVFAGALYEDDNYNYYVPQKNIEYSHSALYETKNGEKSLNEELKNFVTNYNQNTVTQQAAQSLLNTVMKSKYLQVLEQVKSELKYIYDNVPDMKTKDGNNFLIDYKPAEKQDPNDPKKIIPYEDFRPDPTKPLNADDDSKTVLDSHSDYNTSDYNTNERHYTLPQTVRGLIGNEANPADYTARWYLNKLEDLITKGKVVVGDKTYNLNGEPINKSQNFKDLLTEFAVNFFTYDDSYEEDGVKKYYWPNSSNKTQMGVLSRAFYDVRRQFAEEVYYTRKDIYHSNLGKIRDEDDENPKYEIREVTNEESGESVKILYKNGVPFINNFDPEKNFNVTGSSKSDYDLLLDENGEFVFKSQGSDEFYVMDGFKDRCEDDIMYMLYSLYHNDDAGNLLALSLNDLLWKDRNENSGNVRNIVKYANEYKTEISNVKDDTNIGQEIINLINRIFGENWDKDRTDKLNGGMFSSLFTFLEGKDAITENLIAGLNAEIKSIRTEFDKLETYFNDAVAYYDGKVNEAKDETSKKNYKDAKEHMAKLSGYCQEAIAELNGDKLLDCLKTSFSYSGGVENALNNIIDTLKSGEKISDANWTKWKTIIENAYKYDSGYAIYDTNYGNRSGVLAQLKYLAIDNNKFESYDWYKYDSYNSGLYNTVFPYHEKEKKYTGVFPFPLIKGLRPQGMDKRVTEMLIHYGDWLTPDMWATEEYHRDEALSLLIDVDAELQSITKYLTTTGATSQTTGTLKSSIDDAVTNVNTCIETVETVISDDTIDVTVRKDKLVQIQGIISGWLDKDGLLSNLSDACNKALHTGHSDTAEALKTQIENNFKPALTDLLEKIKKIIGA